MRFEYPELLWLLLGIPILLLFFWYARHHKKKLLHQFVQPRFYDLINQSPKWIHILKDYLLALAIVFLIIALARPQYGTIFRKVQKQGVDVLIMVDVSTSMYATDIKPSRLHRAKYEISNFIDKLKGDRIGLLAFAGDAFLNCPLTIDYSATKIFLDILDPNLIQKQGTAIGTAIEKGLEVWQDDGKKGKVMVLLTDGEDNSGKGIEMAQRAKEQGVVIFTVGIGSKTGVPIPLKNKDGNVGYKRDNAGKIVSTKLDEIQLQEIARITGGKYFKASPGSFQLGQVVSAIETMEKRQLDEEDLTQHNEKFMIPLSFALLCLLLEKFIYRSKKRRHK